MLSNNTFPPLELCCNGINGSWPSIVFFLNQQKWKWPIVCWKWAALCTDNSQIRFLSFYPILIGCIKWIDFILWFVYGPQGLHLGRHSWFVGARSDDIWISVLSFGGARGGSDRDLQQDSHAPKHYLLGRLFYSKWDHHLKKKKLTSRWIKDDLEIQIRTLNSLGKWLLR